jgi:hypothetical protein
MAENDIYNSKQKYEETVANFDKLTEKPKGKKKYYCKNKTNVQYFHQLVKYFEVKDLSYIRRRKLLHVLKLITFTILKDLKNCEREDINTIIAKSHQIYKTVNSKRDFIKDLKAI